MVHIRDRRLLILNAQGRRIGESHPRAKLTELDVDLVLRLREAGLSLAGIASKFDDVPGGVSKSTVRDICSGRIRAQLCERLVRVEDRKVKG